MNVLIADDDIGFTQSVKKYFTALEVNVIIINDPILLLGFDFSNIGCVLLDLDMPNLSGTDVLKILPKRMPTIVVSADRRREQKILSLERGADFFIAKPVDLKELSLITLRILGRENSSFLINSNWELCLSQMVLTAPNGVEIRLSTTEFRILNLLFSNVGEVVDKHILEGCLGNDGTFHYSGKLEVLLSRLRKRARETGDILPLKSMRGVGYIFHGLATIRK